MSDAGGAPAARVGILNERGTAGRATYAVDRDGEVRRRFEARHADGRAGGFVDAAGRSPAAGGDGRGAAPRRTSPIRKRGVKRMAVVEVSDQSFAEEVLASPEPVVVDLWAPWCGPCLMLAPRVEALSETYGDKVRFTKLNVDENPETAARFGVMSIPTLLFFRSGQEHERLVGVQSDPRLRQALDALLG